MNLTVNISSDKNYSDCYTSGPDYGVPRYVDIYVNVITAIILVASVVGNILVLHGIRLSKTRQNSHLLIANIAVAELILALTDPIDIIYASRPWDWIFGQAMCTLNAPINISCLMVIPFTLAALSVYRYCILTRPCVHDSATRSYLWGVVVFSWVWGISLSIPVANCAKVETFPLCRGGAFHTCGCYHEVKVNKSLDIYFSYVPFICQYMVPLIIIGLAYGIMVFMVKKNVLVGSRFESIVLANNTRTDPDHTTNDEEVQPTTVNDQQSNLFSKIVQTEATFMKVMFWIIVVYIVCYTPENIIFLTMRIGWLKLDWYTSWMIRRHTSIVNVLSMALHPILFGWMGGIIQRNFNCHL